MSWRTGELAARCGGELRGPADTLVTGISTDTRTVRRGELFVAIAGENFDGHTFVPAALERGAAAVLVSQNGMPLEDAPAIRVDDTVAALGRLARAERQAFAGPVLAITGSNGKTTTKEMAAAVLEQAGLRVRRSPGNLNNQIGLPLSILGLEPDDQVLVVELGMNHAGEIEQLAAIAQPDVGAITQVARAHLGPLGSIEAIAAAKGELLEQLAPGGSAVLNADDPHVMRQRERFSGRVLRFGFSREAEFRAEPAGGGRYRLETPAGHCELRLALPSRHLMQDALCAAAIAWASKLLGDHALEAMRAGLEGFSGMPGRLMPRAAPGDLLVLDDSYNANPRSVEAALDTLSELRGERRGVAVLGDMLELGDEGPDLHARVGRAAAASGIELLICVGALSRHTAQGARAAGLAQVLQVDDADEAVAELRALVRNGDAVLVKGSRGMTMERAVSALVEGL